MRTLRTLAEPSKAVPSQRCAAPFWSAGQPRSGSSFLLFWLPQRSGDTALERRKMNGGTGVRMRLFNKPRSRSKIRSKSSSAFTLIELVISGGLMSIILVAGYVCLSTGTESQAIVEARSDASQTARVALALIAADLRSAVPLTQESEFVGMRRTLDDINADNIDFATRNYVPKFQGEGDWCETSYFVQQDQRTGEYVLLRRRDSTPDPEPLSGGNSEELARGIRGFRLEYYDGWDWYDEWGDPQDKQKFSAMPDPNVTGLPEAVRITLTLATGERVPEGSSAPEISVETTARLNMALFFYETSDAASEGESESGAPNSQPSQAQPTPGGPP